MKSRMELFKTGYVEDWPEIAERVKRKHGYCCEVCTHKHEPKTGYCLTVHHLDRDKKNNEDWNLVSACQRCHLRLEAQAKWLEKHGFTVFDDSLFVYRKVLELPLEDREVLTWERFSVSLDRKFAEWFKPHWQGYLRFKEGNGGKG